LLTDKHVHLLVFGGLALLLLRALAPAWAAQPSLRPALIAAALTVAYGASDEWHQAFVRGRHADLTDLVADAAGACLAMLLAWGAASWHRARRVPPAATGEL
jgi:VanZ family protein